MSADLDWFAEAACRNVDPELFFPDRGEATAPAKAICFGCPVWDQCFEFGLRQRFGIWAGTSERERRRMRKARGIHLLEDDLPDDDTSHPLGESA